MTRIPTATIDPNPDRIHAAIRQFQDQTLPEVHKLPGFLRASHIVNREAGKAMGFTYWATREALVPPRRQPTG
jgi:hypothetical protein